ncbi:MAG: PKD domain-containing protein, partial [bacterium]
MPPVADAGEDIVVTDADGSGRELVQLDGSASFDPDGTIASWSWTNIVSPVATGEMTTIGLGVGIHDLFLIVTDEQGATDSDQIKITVLGSDTVFGDGF